MEARDANKGMAPTLPNRMYYVYLVAVVHEVMCMLTLGHDLAIDFHRNGASGITIGIEQGRELLCTPASAKSKRPNKVGLFLQAVLAPTAFGDQGMTGLATSMDWYLEDVYVHEPQLIALDDQLLAQIDAATPKR